MNALDAIVNTPSSYRVLEFEDLQEIENNLCYNEKISFLFLLYGYENADKGYNKMMKLFNGNGNKMTTYLLEWAACTPNWQNMIRECLVITQCYAILKRLGLDKDEECSRFLPFNNDCSLYIHPMIKDLYYICETLTSKTEAFIQKVEGQNINECLHIQNLEIHITKWIKDGLITMGYASGIGTRNKVELCNVSKLLDALKLMNSLGLYELLKCTQLRLNDDVERLENANLRDILQINQINLNSANSLSNMSQASSVRLENDAEYLASLEAASGKRNTNNTKNYGEKKIEDYRLDYSKMGICLIIDQKEFSDLHAEKQLKGKKLEIREGTEKDSKRLQEVFGSYGYRVIVEENLTDVEIMRAVSKNANRISEQDSSFIVCILSHGQNGAVFGTNCIPVEIANIIELMRSGNLKDKPSILIVQACQIPPNEKAQQDRKLALDSPVALQDAFMPKLSDYLVYMSTVPGFASVRDSGKGSWFIQELCEVFDKHGEEANITELITMINNNVRARRWGDRIMIPVYNSCFSKMFRLPKRKGNL